MRENAVIDKIRVYVNALGGKVIKIHQSGFSETGIPDLIVIHKGMTVFCEAKAPGKEPTKIQLAKIKEIQKAGGQAFWTDSFTDFCKKIDRLTK